MTEEEKDYLDLQEHYSEFKENLYLGQRRLMDYYDRDDLDYDELYIEPLPKSPHDILIERGANLLAFACEIRHGDSEPGWGEEYLNYEIEHILIGCGAETIVAGIHLKLDHDDFIDYLESNSGRTPSFNRSKKVLLSDLGKTLNDEQMGRIVQVLKVMWEKRNNYVHFGFHGFSHYAYFPVAYEALVFLITFYSENEPESTETIRNHIERLRRRHGKLFPPIDFDL